MYVRGYLQSSENGRVFTIESISLTRYRKMELADKVEGKKGINIGMCYCRF